MKLSKFIKHQLILAPLSKPSTSTGTRPVDDDSGTVAKRTNKEQIDVTNDQTQQAQGNSKEMKDGRQ
ncbi:hypothetical protein [Bradyrhizobium sp. CCBAU 51627]|uniref:hypothetical protein n=1 Tax=Bradyrhizobium sp. CCBAU 51627 TaxID=1325088 RepID=UPI00230530D9|nr:hypothetical protein [Bradyrhizobium sp. CCBAU 51627]